MGLGSRDYHAIHPVDNTSTTHRPGEEARHGTQKHRETDTYARNRRNSSSHCESRRSLREVRDRNECGGGGKKDDVKSERSGLAEILVSGRPGMDGMGDVLLVWSLCLQVAGSSSRYQY